MRRLVLSLTAASAALYLGLAGVLFASQRSLLYPAPERVATAAEAGLEGFSDVVVETADGQRLNGFYKPPEPGRALLLYLHGNGGSLWNRRSRVRLLAEGGRGVLAVSYRGYSGSTGSPTEEGLAEDARAIHAFAAARVPPRLIVLYGESLGTGVATRLATERPVGGVVLDAPYTSTPDVARSTYWFVPVDLLMLDQFRSIDRIARIGAPLLLMHGTADTVVPFALGSRLFEAAVAPKRFVALPGIGHTRVLEEGFQALDAFVREIETAPP